MMKKMMSVTMVSWALLGAVGFSGLPNGMSAIAEESPMRVLTVTGQGRERIPTSRARVDLGVEVQAKTAKEAQQLAAQRSTAVLQVLRDRGVDRLQTTGIQLNPEYDYQNGRLGELVGYIARNTVSFELPTEAVGNLIDDAVDAGATQVQGIQFLASESAIAAARDAALRKAAADAQAQANVVLGALNLGAQEIISIQINGAQGPIPIAMPRQANLEVAADVSTPVVGGEEVVDAIVTLQIRY